MRWNGVPIERAVERNAEQQAGSNRDARIARGLESLTLRPLRTGPPPDERWVLIEYRTAGGRRRETRIPWRVRAAEMRAGRPQDPVSTISAVLGIDAGNEATRQTKRELFAPPEAQSAEAIALRSVLDHGRRRVSGRTVGYLRIFSFNVSSARRFAEQLTRILARLPQDGLIVDIRGNPGGNVPAAETTLQLLSEDDVSPVSFSLATTPAALALCRSNPFSGWGESIGSAVETGELYSQAFALSDPPAIADGLPRYPGKTVLITDALCYSAADIFAAGFQDNGLGNLLHRGAHRCGRRQRVDPRAAALVATRAARRAAGRRGLPRRAAQGDPHRRQRRRAAGGPRRAGRPLHRLTQRDITEHNEDLLASAVELLDEGNVTA